MQAANVTMAQLTTRNLKWILAILTTPLPKDVILVPNYLHPLKAKLEARCIMGNFKKSIRKNILTRASRTFSPMVKGLNFFEKNGPTPANRYATSSTKGQSPFFQNGPCRHPRSILEWGFGFRSEKSM